MVVRVGATAGFRFGWSLHSYGFVIPGFAIAGDIKAITLEAGIGLKGKFKPQPRRDCGKSHTRRVMRVCVFITERMKLPARESTSVEALRFVSCFHEIFLIDFIYA
jgi:hypothetical protein